MLGGGTWTHVLHKRASCKRLPLRWLASEPIGVRYYLFSGMMFLNLLTRCAGGIRWWVPKWLKWRGREQGMGVEVQDLVRAEFVRMIDKQWTHTRKTFCKICADATSFGCLVSCWRVFSTDVFSRSKAFPVLSSTRNKYEYTKQGLFRIWNPDCSHAACVAVVGMILQMPSGTI